MKTTPHRTGMKARKSEVAKIKAMIKKGYYFQSKNAIRDEAALVGIKGGQIDMDLETGEFITHKAVAP